MGALAARGRKEDKEKMREKGVWFRIKIVRLF
jgi:hypothetical protein